MSAVDRDRDISVEDGRQPRVLFANVGSDARMKSFNSAWETVLGYDREELQKLRLYELIPLRPLAAVIVVRQVLNIVKFGPMEFHLRCKDGTHKQFLWHRRYNPEVRTMFIAGKEVSGQEEQLHRQDAALAAGGSR